MRRARGGRIATAQRRHVFARTPWGGRIVAFSAAIAAVLGTALFAPHWLTGTTRTVAAYDAGALVLIAAFWFLAMHRDPVHTACRAAVEDPGRNIVLAVVLVCVGFGLASAVVILGHGPHVVNAAEKGFVYAVGVTAIIAGWILIHTIFVFRYAHLFYFDSNDDGSAERGLTFPGTNEPNDFDFAYYSFVIGMTFQVSDVSITDGGVRRLTLIHALISFAYNTTIIAMVINIISGLFH